MCEFPTGFCMQIYDISQIHYFNAVNLLFSGAINSLNIFDDEIVYFPAPACVGCVLPWPGISEGHFFPPVPSPISVKLNLLGGID